MVRITGAEGVVRWGYHCAASVHQWAINKADDGALRLSGTVDNIDDYAVTQPRLRFQVTHGTGSWRWPVIELQILGTSLTAVLGQKEPT